jgi:glycosyltransferase involved in cell wall biosynthesis
VGDIDPDNPASLTVDDLASIEASGNVELWGYRTDIPSVLGSATIVALPSYREGLPKVLLEAAACGRAVVTTDVPGCRDAIESGVTGLLVPSRDAAELAKAIALLLDNPARCAAIGLAGRRLAESEFDVSKVVERHLRIYARLEASAT